MKIGNAENGWERTNVTNLLRNGQSEIYYARVKVNGKQKWKSLKTTLFSVAKLKLADFAAQVRAQGAFDTCHVWPTTSTATDTENEVRSEFIGPPWTTTANRNGPELWRAIRPHFRENGSSAVKNSQRAQDVRLSPPHQACGGGFPHEALTYIR